MRGTYEKGMQDAVRVYRFCDKKEEARHALCVVALYYRGTSGHWGLVSCLSQQAQRKRNSRSTLAAYARYRDNDVTVPTHLGSNYWHACQSKLMRGFPALEAAGRSPRSYHARQASQRVKAVLEMCLLGDELLHWSPQG